MKLIRLTTADNGYFKSSFGNEMTLKPFSKMALLNLTFESDIGSIPGMEILADSKMTVTGQIGQPPSVNEIFLVAETFDFSDIDLVYEKFRQRVEYDLNRLPKITRSNIQAAQSNLSGSQFRLKADARGRIVIDIRYAPFVNPLHLVLGNTGNNAIMDFDNLLTEVVTDVSGKTDINKADTIVASINTSNHISSTVPMSSGSGFVMIRINDLVDNVSGLQDNGFGIGLSKTPLTDSNIEPGQDIPLTKRNFEISINTPTDNYMFINNSGTETDSGIAPANVAFAATNNIDVHDILTFEQANGRVELCLYQAEVLPGGAPSGTRNILATTILKPGEVLYPYLYIRGAKVDCKLDLLNYTADPWVIADTPALDNLRLNDRGAHLNAYEAMLQNNFSNMKSAPIPNVEAGGGASVGSQGRWTRGRTERNFQVSLPQNILHALGFGSQTQYPPDSIALVTFTRRLSPTGGARFPFPIVATRPQPLYNSDNFLVESMSLPLDSYDASQVTYPFETSASFNVNMSNKGRRKNILMTIPVNDNVTGTVEFQTSTPIFIDINNAETINVKNMNFRLLRQDFSPIRQSDEKAIMTILIED